MTYQVWSAGQLVGTFHELADARRFAERLRSAGRERVEVRTVGWTSEVAEVAEGGK